METAGAIVRHPMRIRILQAVARSFRNSRQTTSEGNGAEPPSRIFESPQFLAKWCQLGRRWFIPLLFEPFNQKAPGGRAGNAERRRWRCPAQCNACSPDLTQGCRTNSNFPDCTHLHRPQQAQTSCVMLALQPFSSARHWSRLRLSSALVESWDTLGRANR